MRLVVATMLNAKSSAKPLHLQVARGWAPDHKHAADLLRRALVLLADHELNASTFTVRCAASTGLNLYDSVIAGLVALKGPKHGGAGVLAAQLLKTLASGDVAPLIRERVALAEQYIQALPLAERLGYLAAARFVEGDAPRAEQFLKQSLTFASPGSVGGKRRQNAGERQVARNF